MSETKNVQRLFEPVQLGQLSLANRIVLAPMGFHTAPNGVPDADVAEYYRLRAAGETGLILTEGTFIDHPAAIDNPDIECTNLQFASAAALDGWSDVVRQVHGANGKIIPELIHAGLIYNQNDMLTGRDVDMRGREHLMGPSGYIMPDHKVKEEMTQREIDSVIDAFARGAENARRLGFDGVEIHGAHGYLVDQFFWEALNRRTDAYGGSIRNRSRFAAEIITEIRSRLGPDFPILIRISQWKMTAYDAKMAHTPKELEEWLTPLVDAGVDIFDCSQRRYWLPEFEGSTLNFAGWAKKVTGKPSITCGSVGLDRDLTESLGQALNAGRVSLDRLIERLERDEFDLVAVGRAMIADPNWPAKVRTGAFEALIPFHMSILSASPSHADLV